MAAKIHSTFDREILSQAFVGAFKKLHPMIMVKNPVMFVCEVGAAINHSRTHFQTGRRGVRLWRANCALAVVHCVIREFCGGSG